MTREQIKELDKLWKATIRARGACEKCGATKHLQAHHIFSRPHYGTRWTLLNGVCLCIRCHLFWAHKDAVEFARWIEGRLGPKTLERLRIEAHHTKKMDYEKVKAYLNGI